MGTNLFDDNIVMAYKHLAMRFPKYAHDDDVKQETLIALWKASETFDTNGEANFQTYACNCIENAVIDYLRVKGREISTVSLQSFVAGTSVELQDTIIDESNAIDDIIFAQDFERIIQSCTDETDKKIAFLLLDGKTKKEITEILSISRNTLNYSCRRLKRRFQNYIKN